VGYYHLVFSVPHALVPLMWQNKRRLFALLFEASADTLLEVAADRPATVLSWLKIAEGYRILSKVFRLS
jgi:hypothetical protein